jgi:predicted DNA-binding transcriptional regulator AlpA
MTTTHAAPVAVNLSDEIWTWHHIARYTHYRRSRTMELVREPWFPAPLGLGATARWAAAEVRDAIARAPRPDTPRAPRRSETAPSAALRATPALAHDLLLADLTASLSEAA